MKKDTQHLEMAYQAWARCRDFRARRDRHKRFTFGEQWIDPVTDDRGTTTELNYLIQNNKRPLTNNLLRRMVKTIVGLYRSRMAESDTYSSLPGDTARLNSLGELDARILEEFVISGCAVQRVCDENRGGHYGAWVDNVDPRRFFVNRYSDPRGHDIELIGMLHDMSLPQLVNRFSKGSRSRAAELRAMLEEAPSQGVFSAEDILGIVGGGSEDFFNSPAGRMRVIELWTLEGRQCTVRDRVRVEMRWHCRWMAADGSLLDEYNSDFAHGSHPFAVKLYPLIDGEIHSFVEDVIDQQKTINRHLVLVDSMMASMAKGVLLMPQEALVKGMDYNLVGKLWSKPNSVLPYNARGGVKPEQVTSSLQGTAAQSLLSLHMELFDKTSGVGDALLGQNVSAATGAKLYEAQVNNSAIILTDLLESFGCFIADRNDKIRTTLHP